MIITDAWVLKELKRIGDPTLTENVNEYAEDERDGRSDIEFFADEVSYLVFLYHEEDHDWKYDLDEARSILRKTKNGKVISVSAEDLLCLRNGNCFSSAFDKIEWAKDYVYGYKKLERELKRLQKMGYYGQWYQF